MAKKNKDVSSAVKVEEEPDEEDPAEAKDDTKEDEEEVGGEEIEPVKPPKGEEDTPEFWRKRYWDVERSRTEMDSEYKAKYVRMQDELREAQMKNWKPDDMGGGGDQYGRPPQSSQSITTENAPPFILVKMVEVMAGNGQKILVPREVRGKTFETVPRIEDLPEALILQWGGGEYKIRNRNGVIVGSVNVPIVGDAGMMNPAGMMGQSGMTLGQYLQSPIDRALVLFERAKKDNDPKLAEMAARAIEAELARGTAPPADQNNLQNALATIVSLFGLMQQAKTTFDATLGGGGSAIPEQVQLKKLDLELAREKSKGLADLGTGVAGQLKEVIPQLAQYFKKPDLTPEAVTAAAARLSANTPQPPPTPLRPVSTPSPVGTTSAPRPPPSAPPQQDVVPPGSKVLCGCGNWFTVPEFVAHARTGCPGASGAIQSPTALHSSDQTAISRGGVAVQLPQDLKTYLGMMKTISTYISAFNDGDADASPEAVAGTVWLGTAMNKEQRDKLIEVVNMGYDAIVANPELTKVVEGLSTFPNFTKEQTAAFIAAALEAKILTPEEVNAATDLTDLAPAIDEFKNHIALQKLPKAREWFCRLLNALALKANRPAPHAEFLPGGRTVERSGRDNL